MAEPTRLPRPIKEVRDVSTPDPKSEPEDAKPKDEKPPVGVDTRTMVKIKVKADRDAEVVVLCGICDALEIPVEETVKEDTRFVHSSPTDLMELILEAWDMHGLRCRRDELAKLCQLLGLDDKTTEDQPRDGYPVTPQGLTLALATLRNRIKAKVAAKIPEPEKPGFWASFFSAFTGK